MPAALLPSAAVAALLAALPPARALQIGVYGSDATCSAANLVVAPVPMWGGFCAGSTYQYGLGTSWSNGISAGNTIQLWEPYVGNISGWESWAVTACAPGSATIATWASKGVPFPNPGLCAGAPAQTLTLPLNSCKFDALAGVYKMLLDDVCSAPAGNTPFFMDFFYNSPTCAPSGLLYSSSLWSGAGCQPVEVPSYWGSYQYWQNDGYLRATVSTTTFLGGQLKVCSPPPPLHPRNPPRSRVLTSDQISHPPDTDHVVSR